MRRAIWTLAVLLGAVVPLSAADQEVDLPVTRVVLFSSGVGYFEHEGAVEGDAVARLMFKTEQINDVLKSMILTDLDGGTITSVNYASRDPLLRALKSFGVDISSDPALWQILKQLRGAGIVIEAPEKITGKILTVEPRKKRITEGGGVILTEYVLQIVTDDGIRSVPLKSVQSLRLTDARLSDELNKALALLIASRDTKRKPVEIRFRGKGKRRVRVGYIAETPVWKTTYRLDLSPKKPLLQGWAIVENTQDADWSKVRLALVSGRPISFAMDLYTPLYLPRPVVKPELYASLRPRRYEEGLEAEEDKMMVRAKKAEELRRRGRVLREVRKEAAAAARMPSAPGAVYGRTAGRAGFALGQAVRSVAAAAQVGELFNFEIKEPVDLPRRRSAMLPIINSPIQAEKVSIYNAAVLRKHPLNGCYLVNDTGMKMLGGPITVFDAGSYAGDAQIGNLTPKDKRLISYAIDLNVTVDPSSRSSTRVTSGKIVRGVLYLKRLQEIVQDYLIKNKADAERQIIVEHPYNASRKLVEPEKYEEKTPKLYRFRVAVPKESTKKFTVKEHRVYSETVALLTRSPGSLLYYSRTGELPQAVRDAIAEVIRRKSRIADLEATLRRLQKELQEIQRGQDRLRRNIQTVGKDTTLGKRYLKKLGEQEDQIENLEGRIAELRKQIEDAKKALADYLKDLTIE